jgi:type VI secretion system protein ImpK
VIKPNPGGRRDLPSETVRASAPPAAGQDIWGGTRQTPGTALPQPVAPVDSRPLSSASPTPSQFDLGTMKGATQTGGSNPILEAAMPLLILLSNVRIARSIPQVAPMMNSVAAGIESLEATLLAQNLPDSQVRTAKYVMCATADDIVQNLPSSDRLIWTQYSMLSRFFQVRDSGIGFFEELTKLRQNPQLNHNLLGLMHACMSLGFEGKYRTASGDVALQQIRRDVYQTLRAREARVTEEVSPHWRGQNIAAEHVRRAIPLWAIASAAAGLLLISFMAFRWMLGGMADIAEARLAALHPLTDVNIQRAAFKPFVPPVIPQSTQLERIRARLASDIAENKLSADYAGKDIVVRLLNDTVFDKGSAEVRPGFVASIGRIAGALNTEKGQIRIVGHTDSTPLRSTIKFKDNQDLSEQRARAVAVLLVSGISDPRRLTTQGLADTAPLDTANTPEAKAKNRRVEIFIPREDQQ